MFLISSPSTEPSFNLALEEYFFKQDNNYLAVYLNNSSVIIGKHQIPYKEVDYEFCKKNEIPIFRRLSGGGAVFHDKGNINFSFIFTNNNEQYQNYLSLIKIFLQSFNINVTEDKYNNLFVNSNKISGNARHIFKNRILMHGTMLYDANLNILEKALSGNYYRYVDKSIISKKASVMNLKEVVGYEINEFLEKFIEFLEKNLNLKKYSLADYEIKAIEKIRKEKYQNDDWNYCYSPKYVFRNSFALNNQKVEFSFTVQNGIIIDMFLHCNNGDVCEEIKKQFMYFSGAKHLYEVVNKIIEDEFSFKISTFVFF